MLDYTSEAVEVDKATLGWLPQDTSFGQRLYRAPDGFEASVNVVLMGSDRTSLHKTEFCLEGQGWRIDRGASRETTVHMDRPYPYDLPVMKFIATSEVTDQGRTLHRPGRLCGLVRGRRRRVHGAALAADVVDGPGPSPHRRFAAVGLDQLFHRLRARPGGGGLRAHEEVHQRLGAGVSTGPAPGWTAARRPAMNRPKRRWPGAGGWKVALCRRIR